MTTLNDFIVAAGSYFGIPDGQLMQGSTIDGATGDFEVVFRVALTPDDIKGVAARMEALAAQQVAEAQVQPAEPTLSDSGLRTVYDAMGKEARSRYGSFARFKAMRAAAQAEAMGGAIDDGMDRQ